jgi:tRNA A-37 threonylcarbamoyl transferase component Bud32
LLATLRSIHGADILHGDIQLSNFCVTASGEAFIVDFSQANKSHSTHSQEEKAQEVKDITHILSMDLPTEPAKDSEPAAKDIL